MSIDTWFKAFCDNSKMTSATIDTIRLRYKRITKRINLDYWDSTSETNHSLYVGSYGRGTKVYTSDIDIIVWVPWDVKSRFDKRTGNVQSQFIQEVKESIKKKYSTTNVRGDRQVIQLAFADGISFEIVPAFEYSNKDFCYPDTNNGGSWKTTKPRLEIEASNAMNANTNSNYKRLCWMVRAWKQKCNVKMSGYLIDTLAYKFIENWKYNDKSYIYYDWMSRDFFKYLKDYDDDKAYTYALGSNQKVYLTKGFSNKGKDAYNKSLRAIQYQEDDSNTSAKLKWREIYGTKFPS
ncbi:nucleotidyltransferase domain-containing protein [Candidatus Kapabacteria bacterium]|nr:nucleotidyltransferase domain-containing protein [Candidatus Kapabacteria bacterium]